MKKKNSSEGLERGGRRDKKLEKGENRISREER